MFKKVIVLVALLILTFSLSANAGNVSDNFNFETIENQWDMVPQMRKNQMLQGFLVHSTAEILELEEPFNWVFYYAAGKEIYDVFQAKSMEAFSAKDCLVTLGGGFISYSTFTIIKF